MEGGERLNSILSSGQPWLIFFETMFMFCRKICVSKIFVMCSCLLQVVCQGYGHVRPGRRRVYELPPRTRLLLLKSTLQIYSTFVCSKTFQPSFMFFLSSSVKTADTADDVLFCVSFKNRYGMWMISSSVQNLCSRLDVLFVRRCQKLRGMLGCSVCLSKI